MMTAEPGRFDPIYTPNGFNVDRHNAHTQPDGAYHYHGPPPTLLGDGNKASGVIGFGADGFPIYGLYLQDGREVRKARSSYRLKSGNRPNGDGEPGGTYNGAFRDDYEYVPGLGDLDECNGRKVDGVYRYHLTETFPFVLGCFKGTPDPSFQKSGPRNNNRETSQRRGNRADNQDGIVNREERQKRRRERRARRQNR